MFTSYEQVHSCNLGYQSHHWTSVFVCVQNLCPLITVLMSRMAKKKGAKLAIAVSPSLSKPFDPYGQMRQV